MNHVWHPIAISRFCKLAKCCQDQSSNGVWVIFRMLKDVHVLLNTLTGHEEKVTLDKKRSNEIMWQGAPVMETLFVNF